MRIKIENLLKRFGQTLAVDDISFVAEEGELTCLLGPSGCGKTTTLRCVAGLERPDAGKIWIGDELVTHPQEDIFVPPNKREIGFVFQTFDVWPHLTVYENVAYPLVNRDYSKDEVEERVMDALELTGIAELRNKPATQLSGGQQARVGICRAIVFEPRVLLFDEPLTGLDRNLRQKMRYEIKRIQSELDITSIYVTHSQPEAMTLADKICLLNPNGKIEQMGSAEEIYNDPQSQFTFDFFGSSEELSGKAVSPNEIETDLGTVRTTRTFNSETGDRITVGFRPEDLTITRNGAADQDGTNQWNGVVEDINFLGTEYEVLISVGEKTLSSQTPYLQDGVAPDEEITFNVSPEDVFVYGGS
jgi:ABC-type Fe3+/spermidine/putrescine transport system ATPase subunit